MSEMTRVRTIVTTSWDDGDIHDMKLADLLAEYNLAGTFYYATQNRERSIMDGRNLRRLSQSFEIGSHTLTHPNLRRVPDAELQKEVFEGRRELESLLGKQVEMFCYPKGRFDGRIRKVVKDCGFIGARTTWSFLFDVADPWTMPTTLWAIDMPWALRTLHCARSRSLTGFRHLFNPCIATPWWKLATALFEHALESGGIWHLWGHSWELQERGLWDDLRRVLEVVSRRPDVLYLTNGDVIRACREPDAPARRQYLTGGSLPSPANAAPSAQDDARPV